MDKLIAAFPDNIVEAIEIASGASFTQPDTEIRNIIITGMGGSGIGGKIVSQWVQDEIKVPIHLINDYDIPAFVNENTLVIGSSYSGNTEETLISLEKAKLKGARIIGICSGGDLKTFCDENSFESVVVPGGKPPRTQLAYSIVQLLNILTSLGLIAADRMNEIRSSHDLIKLESENIKINAKKLADFLIDKVGVFYAGVKYEGIAIRARQQFEENSKYLCWHHILPEMNHNELVGWGGGDNRFAVVFMQSGDLSHKNQRRYQFTMDKIRQKTAFVTEIFAKGNSQIERSVYLIHLVDWASWYLAEAKNVDPIDIDIIYDLKDELAKVEE